MLTIFYLRKRPPVEHTERKLEKKLRLEKVQAACSQSELQLCMRRLQSNLSRPIRMKSKSKRRTTSNADWLKSPQVQLMFEAEK